MKMEIPRYELIVSQSPDGIIVHKDSCITLANPAAISLFNYEEEDLIGRSILDLIDDNYRDLASTRIERLARILERKKQLLNQSSSKRRTVFG